MITRLLIVTEPVEIGYIIIQSFVTRNFLSLCYDHKDINFY